jgi:protein involved in polysaccharide export with SLBB domain
MLHLSLLALALSSSPAQPPTGPTASVDSVAVAPATIAQGDRIIIRVWREPALSDSLVVDANGDVVLPRFGTLRVNGWTVSAFQDTVRARFAPFLRNPSIQTTVLRRVAVQGEVKEPNLYYIDLTMTLRDVLALAGGVTENGNPNGISIVRGADRINIPSAARTGPVAVALRSGDQILVSRRSWLSRNALATVSTAGLVLSVLLSVLRK